jgi:hypothetical protein
MRGSLRAIACHYDDSRRADANRLAAAEIGYGSAESDREESVTDEGAQEQEGSDSPIEPEQARKELEALEGDPPQKLEDWPSGAAKYETFGGSEHETSYDEAATSELGPSDVRHHPDGSVTVGGEEVDDPEQYKGEPIPGGPTDPNAPKVSGERELSEQSARSGSDSHDGPPPEDSKE